MPSYTNVISGNYYGVYLTGAALAQITPRSRAT